MKVNCLGARLAITLIAILMFTFIIFIPRSQGQEEASEAPPALVKTETINIKVEFSAPQITAVREYYRVGMEGLPNFGKPGEPELPIRPVRVLIPFGSEVEGVKVSHGREVALDGFYIVEPGQEPVPLSSEAPVEFTPPDEKIYNCSTPFPARIYSDPFPQSKRGYKILILSLYPVSYVPSKGELSYFEEMTVEVKFRPAPPGGLSVRCSSEDRREIMRMVNNPEVIDSYPLGLGPLGGENILSVELSDPTEDGNVSEVYFRDNSYSRLCINLDPEWDICRAYVEWDTSSIPDQAIITKTVFKYHGSRHDVDAHIHEMLGARPSTSSDQAVYDEAGEGTVYADLAGFPEVGADKEVDLGSSANSDLQSLLDEDWFAIGIQSDNENFLAGYSTIMSEEYENADPKPTLYAEYTLSKKYVIITSENLENYSGDYDWQTLCDRKESRGVTTKIENLDSIYTNYDGVDNAEKIRNFIRDAYENWGTEYVLLGGDDTVIPPRFFWVDAGGTDKENIPSDMYYSCLDGTFNYDDDGNWGEPTDGENGGEVDLYAEVYVGRAPVASGTDVSNFVRKTLAFEDFVPENKYLAYMVGEHLGHGGPAEYAKDSKEEVRLGSDNHGYTTAGFASCDFVETRTIYKKDIPWSKDNLIDNINNGVWVLNHLGHGNITYAMTLNNSDLDSLTNTEYFFAYSQTCSAGHFDDENCWAEKVVRMENGAAAVVMNAREGWGEFYSTDAPSQHFDREFWDAVFGESIREMGRANSDSKENQAWYISSDNYGRWCAYELNLFGDPELHFVNLPVAVTISPGENIGLPSSTLDYKVLVWNGNREDNYTLTASDIENWDLTFSENLLEDMQPYETGEVTLSVTISENAVDTEDVITVTVTSKENSQISDNTSCVARVPPERRVEVSVMPKENYGFPSWHVKYCVTVKNTGIENDNYELTVQDNIWPTSLSENLFTNMESIYDNGDARTTILTVTISENAELGTNDSIIFIATSQENENVSDNTSFVVYCGIHEPIYIRGNENFTENNGVTGGSGTKNDPYIMENGTIDASSAHGIHVKNTTAYFIIQNCLVENGGSSYNGIYLNNVVNGRIQNNTCENNHHGIFLYCSDNNLISNNTCENNTNGIHLHSSDNNILDNNTCENNSQYGFYLCGIFLYCSDNNTLDSNTCENNRRGIILSYSINNTLDNNTLSNNQYNFGVDGSDYSHFVHDIDASNLVNGKPIRYLVGHSDEEIGPSMETSYLGIVNCDNIRVENLALGHNKRGILIVITQNSRVENCIFENNDYGIFLWDSDNNTLDNNTCKNNDYYGIRLYGSDNNSIYHNNLINNYNQAYDSGSNYWDDGYPSGGNYWSDYTGEDNYRGENQDIPGSDGIGDTQYYIPGDNNRDRYPLMNPWSPPGKPVLISPENAAQNLENTPTFTWAWGPNADNHRIEVDNDINFGSPEDNVTVFDNTWTKTGDGYAEGTYYWRVWAVNAGGENCSENTWQFHVVPSWTGTADFSLANLYTVNVEQILDLNHGSKLVVKFYDYWDAFENENVIETFSTLPWHVEENEHARHPVIWTPQGPEEVAVEKARLVLTTGDTGNEIATIASYTVCKDDLRTRFREIPKEWGLEPTQAGKDKLRNEYRKIPGHWGLSPTSAGPLGLGFPISDPGGENIEVVQGDNFLIRHVLEWDEPENGAYTVTMAWDCYDNHENENFTFVGASAYFTTGPHENEPINADVMFRSAPSPDYPGGTRYALSVSNPDDNEDPRNGQFNVDVTLGAYGAGGVPHIATNNHPIPFQMGGVIVIEGNDWDTSNRDPITIKVLGRGVSVSISPSYDGAQYGQNTTFSVMVTNTGDVQDNFALTVDNQWAAVLSDNKTSQLSPLESENFTLTVTVPASAKRGDNDKITVTATSQADNTVSDNYYCTAVCGWLEYDVHGEKTAYNIDLECQEPWRYYPKGSLPPIMASKNIITFPPPLKIGRVVAAGFASTCADNQWSENENFHVLVDNIFNWLVRGDRSRNDVLWYTGHGVYYDNERCKQLIDNLKALGWEITANNFEPITTGELENYDIVVIPQLREGDTCTGGDPTQLLNSEIDNLENFVKGADKRGLLVLESSDYGGYNYNRIQNKILVKFSFPVYFQNDEVVDYTSNRGSHYEPVVWVDNKWTNSIGDYYQAATGDNEVGLYRACSLAESADNGVIVSIYPKTKSGGNGENLTFNVIVTNSGKDTDNIVIEVVENEWVCSLSSSTISNLGSWQTDNSVTLTVTVPSDASYGESDNITVKATSQSDPTVSDNYYCTAVCVT